MSSSSIFPATSRRGVLKGILAGAAVGAPALANTVSLTDEEQLETCIAQLQAILSRMHPGVDDFSTKYSPMPDGGYVFEHTAHPPRIEWSGPGYYEIRENRWDKYSQVLWVDEVWSHMDRCHGYRAYHRENGRQIGISSYFTKDMLYIIRQIEGDVL